MEDEADRGHREIDCHKYIFVVLRSDSGTRKDSLCDADTAF